MTRAARLSAVALVPARGEAPAARPRGPSRGIGARWPVFGRRQFTLKTRDVVESLDFLWRAARVLQHCIRRTELDGYCEVHLEIDGAAMVRQVVELALLHGLTDLSIGNLFEDRHQTRMPNAGRSRVPTALPANAATNHSHPCRLVDAMPLKYAPMLQP